MVTQPDAHMVCGFPIEKVEPAGPYKLIVTFHWGRQLIVKSGHNPTEVEAAENRVSRNAKVIESIVLHDGSGPLETIWRHTWKSDA